MDWNIWNQKPDERGKFDGWWYMKQLHFKTDEHRHAAWLAWQAGREELLKEQGEKHEQAHTD